MTLPRKHHYLPQFYLKYFSVDKKKIWQYEKSKEANCYETSIINTAAIKDYHRLDHDKTEDVFAIEKLLSQVEGKQSKLGDELTSNGLSTRINKRDLVFFVLLMRMRVPPMKNFIEESLREFIRTSGHMLLRKGKLPPTLTGLEKELNPDNLKIDISNSKVLQLMFMLAVNEEIIAIFEKMNTYILRTDGKEEFITCDQPVSEFHPLVKYNDFKGCKLVDLLIELSLPISKHALLLLSWNKNINEEEVLSTEKVNEFNRRSVISADSYIFNSCRTDAITTAIRNNYKKNAGFESAKIDFGEGFYHINRFVPVLTEVAYNGAGANKSFES